MKFNKDDLEESVKNLAFEVHHFRCYIRIDREHRLWARSPILGQAVRYSLLIHLRILLTFFSGPPRNDDCWVGHFRVFPGVEQAFTSGKLTLPTGAKAVGENLNKRLAHLTATRWQKVAPPMAFYEKHFNDIETLIETFQAALPDDVRQVFTHRLGEWGVKHPETFEC
jgi:hypothetical protein